MGIKTTHSVIFGTTNIDFTEPCRKIENVRNSFSAIKTNQGNVKKQFFQKKK